MIFKYLKDNFFNFTPKTPQENSRIITTEIIGELEYFKNYLNDLKSLILNTNSDEARLYGASKQVILKFKELQRMIYELNNSVYEIKEFDTLFIEIKNEPIYRESQLFSPIKMNTILRTQESIPKLREIIIKKLNENSDVFSA